jgi:hypothetical protein
VSTAGAAIALNRLRDGIEIPSLGVIWPRICNLQLVDLFNLVAPTVWATKCLQGREFNSIELL